MPKKIVDVHKEQLNRFAQHPFWQRYLFGALSEISWGTLILIFPDGSSYRFHGDAPGVEGIWEIKHYRFAGRILRGGSVGFAEGYLAGDWETPSLSSLLQVFARNSDTLQNQFAANKSVRLMRRIGHTFKSNTKRGSKKNIYAHYDLGNEFYSAWLDKTMTYSSARFKASDQSLSEAQQYKYDSLARQLALSPEANVLEIGSGWGGFAEFAAREYGCNVTGITISREQLEFARERIAKAGLSDKVKFRFQDYRDVTETYDAVASIEMFEAVGESYWPTYFQKIHDVLKPGGRAGLQIITIKNDYFDAYRISPDFIQKYIFPGGMLPSPDALLTQVKNAGLDWVNNVNFGIDYANTLALWRNSFLKAWPQIMSLGFDEHFKRMWRYYLAYCEAGFRAKSIDVTQVTLSRGKP